MNEEVEPFVQRGRPTSHVDSNFVNEPRSPPNDNSHERFLSAAFNTCLSLPSSYSPGLHSFHSRVSYCIRTMSFLGGPECSTAGNPLTQFTKHVQNDNTLQRDRLVGRGPGGVEESMRSRVAPNGSDQVSTPTTASSNCADRCRCSTTSCSSLDPVHNPLRWTSYGTTSHNRWLEGPPRPAGQLNSIQLSQLEWRQPSPAWLLRDRLASIPKNLPDFKQQVHLALTRNQPLSTRHLPT